MNFYLSKSRESQYVTLSFTFTFRFNLIRFASEVVSWKPSLTTTSDDSCQDAVEWVSGFDANGSTSTLSALQVCYNVFSSFIPGKWAVRKVQRSTGLHDCHVIAQRGKLGFDHLYKAPRELHSRRY